MEGIWLISYITLWCLVLLLAIVVLAHSRLIGLLHYRFGPARAKPLADGPEIGAKIESVYGKKIDAGAWQINFPLESDVVLIFVSPQCETCNTLIPHAKDFSRTQKDIQVILFSILDDLEMNRAYAGYQKLEKMHYVASEKLADELNIEGTPYAVYINKHGIVSAKGLTNNYENLIGLKRLAADYSSAVAEEIYLQKK